MRFELCRCVCARRRKSNGYHVAKWLIFAIWKLFKQINAADVVVFDATIYSFIQSICGVRNCRAHFSRFFIEAIHASNKSFYVHRVLCVLCETVITCATFSVYVFLPVKSCFLRFDRFVRGLHYNLVFLFDSNKRRARSMCVELHQIKCSVHSFCWYFTYSFEQLSPETIKMIYTFN